MNLKNFNLIMKFLLFFLSLYLYLHLSITLSTAQINSSIDNNIFDYNTNVNLAELKIIDKKYKDAIKYYNYAFQKIKSPFARDYYNAMICSLMIEDHRLTYFYIEKLIIKGISLSFLKQKKLIQPLLKDKKWIKFENKLINLSPSYNIEKRKEIQELRFADQFFREKENAYINFQDTIQKIDVSNIRKLLNFIQTNGFPSEDLIGIDEDFNGFETPYLLVLIHNAEKIADKDKLFGEGVELSDILKDAVSSGKLNPYLYTYLVDLQLKYNPNLPFFSNRILWKFLDSNVYNISKLNLNELESLGDWLCPIYDSVQLQKINNNRKNIGLENIEDYKKKVIFSLTKNEFYFTFPDSKSVFAMDKQSIDIMSKNFLKISNK